MSALTVRPEEVKRLKGMGFLNNKGTDDFSARIVTVNGKVTASQHRLMADAAEKYGNGMPIPHDFLWKCREFLMKRLKSFRNLLHRKVWLPVGLVLRCVP